MRPSCVHHFPVLIQLRRSDITYALSPFIETCGVHFVLPYHDQLVLLSDPPLDIFIYQISFFRHGPKITDMMKSKYCVMVYNSCILLVCNLIIYCNLLVCIFNRIHVINFVGCRSYNTFRLYTATLWEIVSNIFLDWSNVIYLVD